MYLKSTQLKSKKNSVNLCVKLKCKNNIKEILLDWLMNGMSKEISDLVEDYEVPMTVVKRWKM